MRKLFLILTVMLFPGLLMAQGGTSKQMLVRGNVVFENHEKQKVEGPNSLYFGDVSEQNAKEIVERFRQIKALVDIEKQISEAEDLCKEYHVTSITTKSDEFSFRKNILSGSWLVFIDTEDIEMLSVKVEEGNSQFQDLLMKVNRSPDFTKVIDYKKPKFKEPKTDDVGDGNAHFGVKLLLDLGEVGTDNRLFFQIYAVRCKTDDTLDYCCQVVYEGEKYHELQTKKMGYNYKNDPVAKFYNPNIVLNANERFYLDTTVVWKKPKGMEQEDFRGDFTYVIEDYHHVAANEPEFGSCLIGKPFKLLDFTSALQDIPLSQEFYVRPESQVFEEEVKIDLRFQRGTATLTDDSMNVVKLQHLVDEMKKLRKRLISLQIVGAASPDGSLRVNQELAKKRAEVACRMLEKQGVRGAKSDVVVYTWADVSRLLREKNHSEIASKIDALKANGGDEQELGRQIATLPEYDQVVVPVLEQLRVMSCRYLYKNEHEMEPVECLSAWRENKQAYWDGKIHLSAGDFYNLYQSLKNPSELDSLTTIAYREITADRGYAMSNPMAPYVCNKMALMQMKAGVPAVETLRPFVNFVLGGPELDRGIDKLQKHPTRGDVLMNRHQIVNNQTIAYFLAQKLDTATTMVKWLQNCKLEGSGCQRLGALMTMQQLHLKKNRTPEEVERYMMARDSVLAMSDENKAILYTEIEELGERKKAARLVARMDDTNPKKWYLMGILAADNVDDEIGTEPHKDIPHYLAYFQHCFDLDVTGRYRRYYATEKHVPEKLRKKYPFKSVNSDKFRQLFAVLKKRIDDRYRDIDDVRSK